MNKSPEQLNLPGFDAAYDDWDKAYQAQLPNDATKRNRSGIEVKPLYTPSSKSSSRRMKDSAVVMWRRFRARYVHARAPTVVDSGS